MAGATAVQPAPAATAIEAGVSKLLEQYRGQFESALPRHMRIDHFMRCALTYIKKNPGVGKCTPVSICKALMDAAQLGLAPDGLLGSAYLVPFNNKVKDGGREYWEMQCQLIPGYRGLIDLARRSGEILDIQARPVLAGEQFDIDWGRSPPLTHRPNLDANPAAGNGEQVRGVYAIAFFKDGSQHLEYMSRGEIMGIQARSKANGKGFSPWQTDWTEMARKTVVKRLAKYLPLSPELSRAIELDNDAERIMDTTAVAVADAPATKTEALKRRLKHEPLPDLEAEVAAAIEDREAENEAAIPVETTTKKKTAPKAGDASTMAQPERITSPAEANNSEAPASEPVAVPPDTEGASEPVEADTLIPGKHKVFVRNLGGKKPISMLVKDMNDDDLNDAHDANEAGLADPECKDKSLRLGVKNLLENEMDRRAAGAGK